jgi:hypothetical protein
VDYPSTPFRAAQFFRRLFVASLFGILALAALTTLDRLLPAGSIQAIAIVILGMLLLGIFGHLTVRLAFADEHFVRMPDAADFPTEEQLGTLEAKLGVSLPDDYRRLTLNFPVRFERGNQSTAIWNNAKAILRRNLELREDTSKEEGPWPPHLLFIGSEAELGAYVLDLSRSPAPVLWSEAGIHTDLEPEAASLAELVERYLEDLQALELDPSREYLPPLPWHKAAPGCLALPIVALLTFGGLVLLWGWWTAPK